MGSVFKMTLRTIRTFFGRYMALLLIVALSAGFFAGLKVTTDAMLYTGEQYLEEQNFYDFQTISTLGFTDEGVEEFSKISGVKTAEGTKSKDVLIWHKDAVHPFKVFAVPDKLNMPSLTAGRMPENENECLADTDIFTEAEIGTKLSVSSENSEDVFEQMPVKEYTIVGLTNTPVYLGIDRGTTNIGNGAVYTFLYVHESAFDTDVYTEVNIKLNETAEIYSDDYDELIDKYKQSVTAVCEDRAEKRYQDILTAQGITEELAVQLGFEPPVTYVLTRYENSGYASFESDTGIISGVANIFPIFFIAIAILVCVTTMTRMVDEERTQIGVLKAIGFSNAKIMSKYLIYAASATVIGWLLGFFLCSWALPEIFWIAYNEIYNFAPIIFVFSPSLAAITLAVSLISILGSTIISCYKELMSVPATLIRPRAVKDGKRVLVERIKPLWKRLGFLQKITVRNMFRYKQRLIMMLVGIGCCAGLVVTAFGVRDSMIDVGEIQYEKIQKYDISANFDSENKETVLSALENVSEIDKNLPIVSGYIDVISDKTMSANVVAYENYDDLDGFWDFHQGEKSLSAPAVGEVFISPKIAEKLSLSSGDMIEIRNSDMKSGKVKVTAVFDNHIYDYIVMSSDTYVSVFGEFEENTVLLISDSDVDELAKKVTEIDDVTNVTQLAAMEKTVNDALQCLNYIIWLVIFFSAALAFIVIFNLTNINIAERSREIATVQVLGFYPQETESYVLKENLILSVIASIIGLPLGKVFLTTVMSMVKIDLITFNNFVTPISYLLAFVLTVLFAVVVNNIMKRQIGKINMAESLKAVE